MKNKPVDKLIKEFGDDEIKKTVKQLNAIKKEKRAMTSRKQLRANRRVPCIEGCGTLVSPKLNKFICRKCRRKTAMRIKRLVAKGRA